MNKTDYNANVRRAHTRHEVRVKDAHNAYLREVQAAGEALVEELKRLEADRDKPLRNTPAGDIVRLEHACFRAASDVLNCDHEELLSRKHSHYVRVRKYMAQTLSNANYSVERIAEVLKCPRRRAQDYLDWCAIHLNASRHQHRDEYDYYQDQLNHYLKTPKQKRS